MRLLISLLMLAGFAVGQTPLSSLTLTGPAVAPAGASVTVTIGLLNGTGPAALQWDMSGLPTGATITSTVTGKTATCNATRCVLVATTPVSASGAAAIPDGPIATITYTQPATAAPQALTATLGATPAGAALAVTAPASLTIPVQSRCDLNGDGKTDATDIGIALQDALAGAAIAGVIPTVVDIVRVIIAANGGTCLR